MGVEGEYQITPARRGAKESIGCKKLLWNSETGECLGRTGQSWGRIAIFYLILYSCLTALFTACLMALHSTTRDDKPKYHIGNGQAILVTPGMKYVPTPRKMMDENPVLSYSVADASSYENYVTQLRTFLTEYVGETSRNVETCDGTTLADPCPLDPTAFGDCWDADISTFDFGYDVGKPCIVLRINKVYNWIPELYSTNPDVTNIGSRWNESSIPVTCETFKLKKTSEDIILNDGDIDFYPEAGFPGSCYPFCGRTVTNYLPPLTMIKLQNITRNTKVPLWCKFRADGSSYARRQGLSSASLVIKIND